MSVSPQTQDVNIDEVPSITLSCTVTTNRPDDTIIEWTSSVRSGVLASGTGTSLDLVLNTTDLADVENFTCTAVLGTDNMSATAVVNIFCELAILNGYACTCMYVYVYDSTDTDNYSTVVRDCSKLGPRVIAQGQDCLGINPYDNCTIHPLRLNMIGQ